MLDLFSMLKEFLEEEQAYGLWNFLDDSHTVLDPQ